MARMTSTTKLTLTCSTPDCTSRVSAEGSSDKCNLTQIRLEQAAREAGWWLQSEPNEIALCPTHVASACEAYEALGIASALFGVGCTQRETAG